MAKMGFTPDAAPCCFSRSVVAEADDEIKDPDVLTRPYIEKLADRGIRPRRIHTQIHDIGVVTMGSALSAAAEALKVAASVLRRG